MQIKFLRLFPQPGDTHINVIEFLSEKTHEPKVLIPESDFETLVKCIFETKYADKIYDNNDDDEEEDGSDDQWFHTAWRGLEMKWSCLYLKFECHEQMIDQQLDSACHSILGDCAHKI